MRWLGAVMLACAVACAVGPVEAQVDGLEAPSWRTIARFRDDAEFYRYLSDVRAAARRARASLLRKQAEPEDCPPEMYPCAPGGGEDEESIVVTGARVAQFASPSPVSAPAATSITNVQNAGVDEGDIVKLYGRFLIVLQDGRLFSADTGRQPGELALVDRVNVYRSPGAGVWYDEMLISGNRVVVTGYNYGEGATEFSVFTISDEGRFTREAVYFLSSNDYYDNENYATRLVNGNLVIYTPLAVGQMQASARVQWPIVRRWVREGDAQRAVSSAGRNLFDADDIHRPIQATYNPVVHTISVCPLGQARPGDELDCSSTAVVAPPGREFYVSTSHIYLWTWPIYEHEARALNTALCDTESGSFEAAAPSALFQVPLAGGTPRALFVRGRPWDQLSMDANGREFRALDVWDDARCRTQVSELPLRYLSTPLSAFSTTPGAAPRQRFTPLPSVGGAIENRFTDTHLVYGGRDAYSSYAPAPDSAEVRSSRIVVMPTANPRGATTLEAGHSALRVERVGDNAIVTGYRDWRGLSISLINLSGAPRISSTAFLPERYETEGRSHAFNAAIDPDGAGLMGLPTEMRRAQSGRWWWRSRASDVSYLALRNGELTSVGAVRGTNPKHPDYACEVSCIDWYGNTRALFIAVRIFGLSGTELIEAELTDGAIRDRARLNLTETPRSREIATR